MPPVAMLQFAGVPRARPNDSGPFSHSHSAIHGGPATKSRFSPEYFQREDEGDDSVFYESPRLVVHIDEEVPGEGVLDVATALQRWEQSHPDGYMLVEHLPEEKIPDAVNNVRVLARDAGVDIH